MFNLSSGLPVALRILDGAKHDKLKVLKRATTKDVEAYLRQNGQYSHDAIVVRSR